MKIVILGAGQVGGTLAEHLATEANDITLVDINSQQLEVVQEQSDIRTIMGNAAHPDILRQAGIEDADIVVAVTNSDETNMLACQIAHSLFNTPIKIARVRESQFLQVRSIFCNEAIPVDVLISPELLVTNFIKKLIEYPGSLQVLDFANNCVQLVAVKALAGGALIGEQLNRIPSLLPNIEMRISAIFRQRQPIELNGQTTIESGDEVFFLAARSHVSQIISKLRAHIKPYKRIIIAGGGRVGLNLAKALENKYLVKVIEKDSNRCKIIAEALDNTIVLKGDASDKLLLLNERIADTDVFCALTNNDYTNIMAALMAKKLNARKVMALITKQDYIELIEGGEIDIAISPQQATVSGLLSHIRKDSTIVRVYTLRHGAAQAIEMAVLGNEDHSKITGMRVEQIKLPKGTSMGAIVRQGKLIVPHHDTVLKSKDRVILFLLDVKQLRKIEKLFQVRS